MTNFRLMIFCLTMPEIIVGELLNVSESFWYRKIFRFRLVVEGEWVSRLCVQSHCTENVLRGNFPALRKILVSRNFLDKRGGGCITFLLRKYLSHSAEKFLGGNLLCLCFRRFRLSKIFLHKKGISLFSDESFLSHNGQSFLGQSLHC